ncbi:alanine--tRNA ligase [Candidatus Auribacterota bacterium]
MRAEEIREKFLNFFKNKGHTICPSSPIVPENDPTLLFTTAGMVQFKALYAGAPLKFPKAASVQKCLRAGGKGSDLQNVGKTLRHHTFFEMLGNFSFGDYFKEEAITWAWEFMTKVINLPPDKLYVSIYQDDDEAFRLWNKKIGIPEEKIFRLGDADNFWGPAGNNGACGPCSEIYFDLGEEKSCGKPDCQVGCDCERYLEFWNLVFPQFYQEEDGSRRALERRGVDTGMGLERLAFILQHLKSDIKNNYETDLFSPLISEIDKITPLNYSEATKFSFYVIADHIRALTFSLSENILPSNEGRGYVLRKILRRAIRHGRKLKIEKPFLYQLIPFVCEIMKTRYPELEDSREHVSQIILREEEKFQNTINRGLELLDGFISETKEKGNNSLPNEAVFALYDTYGFPVDLTEEITHEEGLTINLDGFNKLMKEQQAKAKQSHKKVDQTEKMTLYESISSRHHSDLKFVGYEKNEAQTIILQLIKKNNSFKKVTKDDQVEVILKETPFYGESGGQIGDSGMLSWQDGKAKIIDTQKPLENLYIHLAEISEGTLHEGETVRATVDKNKRSEIAKNHTATHLLHYAMREVLGDHIKQAGSLVEADRLRFDFSHFAAVSPREIQMIEDIVNQKIRENQRVDAKMMSLEEGKNSGAIALFGDKYGDQVRVLSVGDFSKELCGGTHITQTGEIGLFKIISEGSISSGIRRIEAICSREAFNKFQEEDMIIQELNFLLKTEPKNIITQVEKLFKENRAKDKEILALKEKQASENIDEILNKAVLLDGIKVLTYNMGEIDGSLLRKVGDRLRKKIDKGIIALAGHKEGKVSLISIVTPDLIKKGYHAGNIVKELAKVVGGGGGGRPDMAQAGGKKVDKIDESLAQISQLLKKNNN